jgi:hypothetical protein
MLGKVRNPFVIGRDLPSCHTHHSVVSSYGNLDTAIAYAVAITTGIKHPQREPVTSGVALGVIGND